MAITLSTQQWNDLLGYQESRWGHPPGDRWLSLCTQLRKYAAPVCNFAINAERKWELVSALQKSIRRGEKQVALKMVSAMNSMPEESAYFWRRLCVIACEDVGPGDDGVVKLTSECVPQEPWVLRGMLGAMNPLMTLLKADPAKVDTFKIEQVVSLCGDGKLNDNTHCSTEFREYLQIAKSENLQKYLQTCLESSIEPRGLAFQDLVNELGRRLDYTVENGLYRGKSNAIGFDGLWFNAKGHCIVVEVKTTDAYRINLDTVTGYRESLIASGKITKESSVLIVVGRQDTGDLEAQVRGSKHAWTIRLISVDALLKLVTLKENSDLNSVGKIHDLLVPFEYTKLDKIIEIAFSVAEDTSTALKEEQSPDPNVAASAGDTAGKQQHTAPELISELRARIVSSLTESHEPLVKKSRALYWSADKSLRVAITISKQYEDGGFWYAYHSDWDEFLAAATDGFYILGCIGRDEAYALPFDFIHSRTKNLSVTAELDGKSHWHTFLSRTAIGDLVFWMPNGQSESVEQFKMQLGKAPEIVPAT